MKIQQTAFMLIALVIFFALAAVFMISFKLSSLKKDVSLLDEKNALLLVTKIAESPEFSCGQAFGGKRVHCVDFDKMLVLKDNIDIYSNFWEVANLEIRLIDKSDSVGEIECTSSNYPNCNYLRLISQDLVGGGYSTFVVVCRKSLYEGNIYDQCDLGKFIVSYGENE